MDKPIRVAQVLNRMDSGGIEAVVMNYYRNIDRSKVQFDFYFAEDSHYPQREELERLGARVYLVPAYSHLIRYHRALYSAFKERRYPIIHAHMSTMSLFPVFAAWRAKVPVRICHGHSTANWGEGKKTLLKYLLRPLNKVFANRWFACGEMAGRWMYGNRAFDSGRVHVMLNAIDVKQYAFDPVIRERLRDEFGIARDAFVVGHVGRFTYAKNHRFLFSVFLELLKKLPEAKLFLVGEGEKQQEIRELVKSNHLENSVIFGGVRQDVYLLYSVMDVFCLPSHYEGFSLVAIEAQAAGLPCICSLNVSRDIDLTPRAVHLPTGKNDAPKWAERILSMPVADHATPEFSKEFRIEYAAGRYQEYIGENYEKALPKR